MSYVVVAVVSLFAAALTFFSGFGLGTLLLPAFSFFFPVEIAIAATAVVHLANNVFKLGLVGRAANPRVLARFAIPAAAASIAGAFVLTLVSEFAPLATYSLGGREHMILPVKVVIGVLMIGFSVAELSPRFGALTFDAKLLPLGGVVSGFFGGLSGHQGAFRSAFLIKAGLSKEAFIATGVASAVVIDVARVGVYGASFFTRHLAALGDRNTASLVAAAAAAAFLGSFIGARAVKKVTLRALHLCVGAGLVVLGLALGAGLI